MPNKPISIEFTAKTDAYERELKNAGKATEKLADTIEQDVPRATEKMADKAERDFERVGDEAKETGREAGQNFTQSLGEGLGSGDLSEVVQETLGEAVGSMSGPVSAAVGLIAGASLLVWNKMREEAEKTQKAIADQTTSMWSSVLASVEGQIGSSFARINKQVIVNKELERLWNDEPEGMQKLVEASEQLGLSAREVAKARAGDEDALKRVKAQVDGILEGTDLTTAASRDTIDAVREISGGWEIAEESVSKTKTMTDAYNTSVGTAGATTGGLVDGWARMDTNMDGAVSKSEMIAANIKAASGSANGLFGALADMQNLTIPIHIKYTTNAPGGAFATSSGGQLAPIYGGTGGASS